jgi:hypothetical protein
VSLERAVDTERDVRLGDGVVTVAAEDLRNHGTDDRAAVEGGKCVIAAPAVDGQPVVRVDQGGGLDRDVVRPGAAEDANADRGVHDPLQEDDGGVVAGTQVERPRPGGDATLGKCTDEDAVVAAPGPEYDPVDRLAEVGGRAVALHVQIPRAVVGDQDLVVTRVAGDEERAADELDVATRAPAVVQDFESGAADRPLLATHV